jgi:hypothetical protein
MRWQRPRRHTTGCARFLHPPRIAGISRRRALTRIALLICAGLAPAASGCGFLALIFKGENQQTMREIGVCDDLASDFPSEIPSVVELRTDKAGVTRYRALSLGGSEVEPQWVPAPNPHGNAPGWVQAGNFLKMDFQPPLQSVLKPDSSIYLAYAAAEAHSTTEQAQLGTINKTFGPDFGSFRWNGRAYRYATMHKLPCLPPPQ